MKKKLEIDIYNSEYSIQKLEDIVAGDKNIISLNFNFIEFYGMNTLNDIKGTVNIIDNYGSIVCISNLVINDHIEFTIPNELLVNEKMLKIQLMLQLEDSSYFFKQILNFKVNENLLNNPPDPTEEPNKIYMVVIEEATKKVNDLFISIQDDLKIFEGELESKLKVSIEEYIKTFFIYSTDKDAKNIINKYN